MRILRTYEHVAQIEHWCDYCCRYIMPGELYRGSVELWDNNKLLVFKRHIDPECDFPLDPEEEMGMEIPEPAPSWRLAA